MAIMPYAAGSIAARRSGDLFVSLRSEMDGLQTQLSTGRKAESFGELGLERRTSLDARGRLAAIEGYAGAIDDASFRLKVMTTSVEQVAQAVSDSRVQILPPQFNLTGEGRTVAQRTIGQKLQFMLDVLNTDVNGRYLFAGRASDKAPVESFARIMDGDPPRLAGVNQLVAERKDADLGAGSLKLGRLGLTTPTTTSFTLAEDADASVRANFGFVLKDAASSNPTAITVGNTARAPAAIDPVFDSTKPLPKDGDVVRVWVNRADGHQDLVSITARATATPGANEFAIGANAAATSANLKGALAGLDVAGVQADPALGLTATQSGGTAGANAFNVVALPAEGDTITVKVGLRDGTETTITLTAKTTADPASTAEFAVGGSPQQTALSLKNALTRALDLEARTSLAASSALRASADFFDGSTSPGGEPRRIAGSAPFTAATGFATAPAGKTVIWYKGDDAPGSARATAPVQIDQGQSIGIGARANEPAIRAALAQFAAVAGETFTDTPADKARYSALATRAATALTPTDESQTVAAIGSELGLGAVALNGAKERHASTKAFLEDAIAGVEEAKPEAVAAALLALQTRLQASYQTTAMLSRLSLVSYL